MLLVGQRDSSGCADRSQPGRNLTGRRVFRTLAAVAQLGRETPSDLKLTLADDEPDDVEVLRPALGDSTRRCSTLRRAAAVV
jgi:hypothetical protein